QDIQRLNEELLDMLEQGEPTDWRRPQPYWLNHSEWLLTLAEAGDPRARVLLLQRLDALRQSPLWDARKGGFYTLMEGLDGEGKPWGGKRLIENARLLSLYARAARLSPALRPVADALIDFLRVHLWQERPPGFRASVPPEPRAMLGRQELPVPPLDTTLYADGNALAILALLDYAELSLREGESTRREWALRAAARVMETLRGLRTIRGDLYHSSRRQVSDWLPDLALVARAASRLYSYQRAERTLRFAHSLLELIETDYRDPTGGYYDMSQSKRWASWTLQPMRLSVDMELPADNALVAMAQLEFARALQARMVNSEWRNGMVRSEVWRQRAERTLQVMLGDRPEQLERFAGFARAASMFWVSL
ncbi:MAG: hypothetical protein NZL85_00960, partial [Fimbriimonadales bacterium]|nr:hypothetical protein [Fimbriimonadales bacterium]